MYSPTSHSKVFAMLRFSRCAMIRNARFVSGETRMLRNSVLLADIGHTSLGVACNAERVTFAL